MIAEQEATLAAGDGVLLEARIALPPGATAGVVVCHPHPLYGGDMDSPVVARVVEVCAGVGLATCRFNFRGVGRSTGQHDEGRGEQRDAEAALDHLRASLAGGAGVALAGYSFGSVIAAQVAAGGRPLAGLALIAPPVAMRGDAPFAALKALDPPLLLVAGSADPYCPRPALDQLARQLPRARVRVVEGADHFFGGALSPLGEAVREWARALGPVTA